MQTTEITSGYYAPLAVKHTFQPFPAWTVYVGTTPDGKWVAEFHSAASSRYERHYFDDEQGALAKVEQFAR